jgi:hypothetical protein
MGTLEQLIEEPWHAADLLSPLSDAERAAIRQALLDKVVDEVESGVPAALGSFPDAEVLAALQRVLTVETAEDVYEAAVESIGKLSEHVPAAQGVLRELLDHEDDGVVRVAIEYLDDPKLLLPRVDALAARGADSLMEKLVERLLEDPTPDVVTAIARHWDFVIKHGKTAGASNAIFDALIDHAPQSKEARAVFAAAVAHDSEYAKVRGHAALALTTDAISEHVEALNTLKGLKPSGLQLRKNALVKLVKTRRPDLEKLAAAGDETAGKLLA